MNITDLYESIADTEVKSRAIANHANLPIGFTDANDVTDALIKGFDWVRTPEGGEYWSSYVYGDS